ncbi:hypothetical protein GBAR_LOCUS12617, partial [Geodia barretti]
MKGLSTMQKETKLKTFLASPGKSESFGRRRTWTSKQYRRPGGSLASVSTPRHAPERNGLRPRGDTSVPTWREWRLNSLLLLSRHTSGVE